MKRRMKEKKCENRKNCWGKKILNGWRAKPRDYRNRFLRMSWHSMLCTSRCSAIDFSKLSARPSGSREMLIEINKNELISITIRLAKVTTTENWKLKRLVMQEQIKLVQFHFTIQSMENCFEKQTSLNDFQKKLLHESLTENLNKLREFPKKTLLHNFSVSWITLVIPPAWDSQSMKSRTFVVKCPIMLFYAAPWEEATSIALTRDNDTVIV